MAFVPLAVFENTEILKKLAGEGFMGSRHRHIVGGPGIRSDLVLAPAGVASGFVLHFEDDEIAIAFFVKTPSRAESGGASANDRDSDFLGALGSGEGGVVANAVAERKTVVHESTVDAFFSFGGESNEGGSYCAEESPSRRHLFSVALLSGEK